MPQFLHFIKSRAASRKRNHPNRVGTQYVKSHLKLVLAVAKANNATKHSRWTLSNSIKRVIIAAQSTGQLIRRVKTRAAGNTSLALQKVNKCMKSCVKVQLLEWRSMGTHLKHWWLSATV